MATATASDDETPLVEIVFSCCVCQATPSEVYATDTRNEGSRLESSNESKLATKMWIADCSHITCAAHLDGGAVPFHSQKARPQAVCPECRRQGDQSLRDLYPIRGLSRDELDPEIPDTWLRCPPTALDQREPEMEALRFQFTAIARYAHKTGKRWRESQRTQIDTEQALQAERSQHSLVRSNAKQLEGRVLELEEKEARLAKWEERRPQINHYLGVVAAMANDIEQMRSRLFALGHTPPECKYTFDANKGHANKTDAHGREIARGVEQSGLHNGATHHVRQRSPVQRLSSSSKKRKLAGNIVQSNQDDYERHYGRRRSSRDLMPPPGVQRDQTTLTSTHAQNTPRGTLSRRQNVASSPIIAWPTLDSHGIHPRQRSSLDRIHQVDGRTSLSNGREHIETPSYERIPIDHEVREPPRARGRPIMASSVYTPSKRLAPRESTSGRDWQGNASRVERAHLGHLLDDQRHPWPDSRDMLATPSPRKDVTSDAQPIASPFFRRNAYTSSSPNRIDALTRRAILQPRNREHLALGGSGNGRFAKLSHDLRQGTAPKPGDWRPYEGASRAAHLVSQSPRDSRGPCQRPDTSNPFSRAGSPIQRSREGDSRISFPPVLAQTIRQDEVQQGHAWMPSMQRDGPQFYGSPIRYPRPYPDHDARSLFSAGGRRSVCR